MTKQNKAYFYDPVTREFVGIVLLDRDPLGGGFLLPANAVTAKPVLVEDKAPVLSDDGQTWLQVDDYRGLDVYQITDGTAHRVNALGALPDGVTTIKPAPAAGERIAEFDVKNQSWLYRPDYTGVTVYSTADGAARILTESDVQIPDGYTTKPQPTPVHDWDAKKSDWTINKTKQAEIEEAARKAAIPKVVTIRQAKRALLAVELLDDVEAIMASDAINRAMKIDWENAIEVRREWVEQSGLMSALKMSDAQLDQLFALAATL